MPHSRRYLLYIVFLALITVLGLVFRSFLFENFARPVALVFWFILRLFAAVDQKIYWVLLIFFAFFQAVRHIPQRPETYVSYPETVSWSAVENVKNWRTFINLTTSPDEIEKHNILRQNLLDLLVGIYSTDQEDGAAAYAVYDALKRQQITLPEPVYQFLFIEASVQQNTLAGLWLRIRLAPGRWIRRWRGQDTADYYQSIDTVLSFMETSLEITHDNQNSKQPND